MKHKDLTIATILLVISLAINVITVMRVTNRPIETVVIHKADNAVELHGKVTGKSMVGKLYTIDCGAYGKFLVSKEQYDSVEVGDNIPNYLMQSTGLKDKNGKEIFEGDVVKMAKNVYSEPTYYEVVRHRGGAYRLESKQYGCELWLRHTDCEIAGNIWEHPELAEVDS